MNELAGSYYLCLKEAFTPEMLKQYNRLNGTHLGMEINRSPIVQMIDEATGYDKEIDKRFILEMIGFECFVGRYIWLPWLATLAKDAGLIALG